MEAEQNFKKEYDNILVAYSKRKSQNATYTKSISELENNIATLQSQLSKYPEEDTGDNHKLEIAALSSQIHQQQQLIKQVEADIKNSAIQFDSHASRLRVEHNHHQAQLNLSNEPQTEELNKLKAELQNLHRAIADETLQISSAKTSNQNDEALLAELQVEIAKLIESEKQLSSLHQNVQSVSTLESELAQNEKSLTTLQNELRSQKAHKASEKEKLEGEIKSAKKTFASEQAEVKQKQSKKQSLEKELSNDGAQKINQLQAQIKKLENKNTQIQKDIDTLAQTVQTKKAQKAAHQEELRKYKEKKERNYKQEAIEAEKIQQNLKKQMDREKQKLADVLKLSKTYVSQQNLQILQKQLARHQAASSRVSVEAEDNKKTKHLKENQILKSRIQYLRTTSRNLEQQTERNVRELRKSGDELVKEKLAQEKVFNQTTNKLNQYMKEYPDHEKNKEFQKLEEKRKKAQEKEKIREAAREQREKRKQQEQKVKDAELPPISAENPNLPAWEKWDRDVDKNLPARDQASIFNNRQFQLAAGIVALLAILFLAFA